MKSALPFYGMTMVLSMLSDKMHSAVPWSLRSHIDKPAKNCIFCGESHYHNNAFCSSGCAKGYKEAVKQRNNIDRNKDK